MKFLRQLVLLLVLSPGGSAAPEGRARSLEDVAATRALAERAVAVLREGTLQEAYAIVRPYWQATEHHISALMERAHAKRLAIEQRSGRLRGIEFSSSRESEPSYVVHLYLEKYEGRVAIWLFRFHQQEEGWVVTSVVFSDQVEKLRREPRWR